MSDFEEECAISDELDLCGECRVKVQQNIRHTSNILG
jgi:hypothetical protein